MKHLSAPSIFITLTLLSACGGGGGGGSDSGTDNGLSYTGKQTPAELNRENSKVFANLLAQQNQSYVGSALGVTSTKAPPAVSLTERLVNQSTTLVASRQENAIGAAINETQNCTDAGSVNVNINANEQTGNFSGSFKFNNCSEGGEILDGDMAVNGVINTNTSDINSMEVSTTRLTFSNSFVMSGEMSCQFGEEVPSPFTEQGNGLFVSSPLNTACNQNITYKDLTSDETFKYVNFKITYLNQLLFLGQTEPAGINVYTMEGRIFHPNLGYVDVIDIDEFGPSAVMYAYSGGSYPAIAFFRLSAEGVAVVDTSGLVNIGSYTLDLDTDSDGTIDETYVEAWDF